MSRSSSKSVLRGRPTDRHVRVADDGRAVEVVDVRQRFGGIDVGASIAGALAALGVTVLLGGIAGSIGTVGYQLDLERGTDTLSAGGLAAGLVVLLAAFLIGGWVAGRMARYDGGKNGLLTAVWFIVVAAVLAGAGAWLGDKYDVFTDLRVPQWFSSNATTTGAIVSGVVAAAVMLIAGLVGGIIGSRYHVRADEYLAAEERDLFTHQEPIDVIDDRTHDTAARVDESPNRAHDADRDHDAADRDRDRDRERLEHERPIDLRGERAPVDADRRPEVDLLEGMDLGTAASGDERRAPRPDPRTTTR